MLRNISYLTQHAFVGIVVDAGIIVVVPAIGALGAGGRIFGPLRVRLEPPPRPALESGVLAVQDARGLVGEVQLVRVGREGRRRLAGNLCEPISADIIE